MPRKVWPEAVSVLVWSSGGKLGLHSSHVIEAMAVYVIIREE